MKGVRPSSGTTEKKANGSDQHIYFLHKGLTHMILKRCTFSMHKSAISQESQNCNCSSTFFCFLLFFRLGKNRRSLRRFARLTLVDSHMGGSRLHMEFLHPKIARFTRLCCVTPRLHMEFLHPKIVRFTRLCCKRVHQKLVVSPSCWWQLLSFKRCFGLQVWCVAPQLSINEPRGGTGTLVLGGAKKLKGINEE